MKYIFVCLLGGLATACNVSDSKENKDNVTIAKGAAYASEARKAMADSTQSTTIEWLDPVVRDLGAIQQGQVDKITWKFKNTGSKALFITDVRAACGCTTPDVPKEPIAPGGQSEIKAKFNSQNFSGHVTKEVYVQANNSNRNKVNDNKLTFTADIK